jgi:hypothetical protein
MTLAMFVQVACTDANNDEEEVGDTEQAVLSGNVLSGNVLSGNVLSGNVLSGNVLSGNVLSGNLQLSQELENPDARELLSFIVSCALPAEAHFDVQVQGQTYGFDGRHGLAPVWGEDGGSCDEECRSWVSACVISRVNYLGEHVTISIRGKHDELATTLSELIKYPFREATYYGDIFASPQEIFACLPPGKNKIPRVCGPSLDDCVVDVQGKCEDLCGQLRFDGSYASCREKDTPKPKGGTKKGAKHKGAVTVFLAPPWAQP